MMEDNHPTQNTLPQNREEKVLLEYSFGSKKRGFAAFLIGCALLIAAFAITALWIEGKDDGAFGKQNEGTLDTTPPTAEHTDNAPNGTQDPLLQGQPPAEIPQGAVAIVSKDLSCSTLGNGYLHNETDYIPSLNELLNLKTGEYSESTVPRVLILHTHTSESYLKEGSAYVEGSVGDVIYSNNAEENVLSVGAVLCQTLNENGVPAIHCQISHDASGLSGSYERSAETVRAYLREYPSIEYVIDLHRDSIMTSDGSIVRSETKINGEPTAQVLAVVGSDRNGTVFANGWEHNLALALQLRELLNANGATLCRPVSLRTSSFHQELSKYSLLLEIGTAANSPNEAKRAAVLVGEALAKLIQAR